MTATAFGALIERHKSTVTRILKKEVRPDQDTMDRILRVTKNQVTPNDFFGVPASNDTRGARKAG